MTPPTRYDEHVEWFEEFRPALSDDEVDVIGRFLGRGPGRCLDVGCGTGVAIPELVRLGWTVTGVDSSEAMFARAAERVQRAELVVAGAEALPFEDATFDAALSVWTHTDVDDFTVMVPEVARVLRPRAPFAYVGAHPCFVGPHSRFAELEGLPTLHPGYRRTERYDDGPAVGPDGLRARVGATHLPLDLFLRAFLDPELEILEFEELGRRQYPHVVALRCRAH